MKLIANCTLYNDSLQFFPFSWMSFDIIDFIVINVIILLYLLTSWRGTYDIHVEYNFMLGRYYNWFAII